MKKSIFILAIILVVISILFYFISYQRSQTESEVNMSWINNALIQSEAIQVKECEYNSEKVYYFVNPECCDFIDNIYNSKGEVICSFGGIAGLNTCPDFDNSSCKKDVWNIPNNDDITNCIRWKDDCNTCTKDGCTEMACSERTGIKCLEYNSESNANYSNLQEYLASIDYSCNVDSDCAVKNVQNCCGYYPACTNKNAKTDPDFVRRFCSEQGMSSVCGWPSIQSCECVSNRCEPAYQ